jgi:primosomal protein N''
LNYANLFQLIFTLRIFDYLSKKRKIQKLSTALRRDLKRAQDNLDFAESVRAVESLKNRINRCKSALAVCEKDIENMNNFN